MNPTPVFLPYLYATICGPRVVTLSLCPSRVTRKKNGRVSSPGFYAAISPRGFLQSRSTNKPKEAPLAVTEAYTICVDSTLY